MTRKQAKRFLFLYFSIAMAAIIFRVDNFPLTWVPMYAEYKPKSTIPVRVWNYEDVQKGFRAFTRDGTVEYINPERLNIPRTKFIRLYYERIYGLSPPKDLQSHYALSDTNRYLRELIDPDPATSVHWDWRILYSLNKSLGRETDDANFIVTVEAPALERQFSIQDLNNGNGVTPTSVQRTAVAQWNEEWRDRWARNEI